MVKTLFAVIGGDQRSIMLYKFLRQDGHIATAFGLEKSGLMDECAPSLEAAVEDAPYIIGPIPCSQDGVNIRTPLSEHIIPASKLFDTIAGKCFIAGALNTLKNIPGSSDSIDLLERKEMPIKNAIPTVEGALMLAIQNTSITLHNSNCLVMGYGRIGKLLAKHLYSLGAKVWVSAKRIEDLTNIEVNGYTPLTYSNWSQGLKKADVIFNTVPVVLLRQQELMLLKHSCLIIDVASAPYGVDYEEAKALNIMAVCAQSLPGKVAPETAALYIRDTIYNIVNQQT